MALLDLFRRTPPPGRPRNRGALVASAALVTPAQGTALAKGSKKRAWQKASFVYRKAVPEVGYVMRFLGNNSNHIRLFVGDRPPGSDETTELDDDYGWILSDDGTSRVRDPDALPEDLVAAAQDALNRLTGSSPSGGGAAILSPVVQAFEGPGECWLVGTYDPEADRETWAIHSISEMAPQNGVHPALRDLADVPDELKGWWRLTASEGSKDGVDLDPRTTTVVRLWTADPEWSDDPDSPMRTLVGTCERLLLIDRANDAALRSRASGNGVLILPDEISFTDDGADPADPDNLDAADDAFMRDFTTQLVTPLTQDGSAASVVPMLLRGPYAYLDRIRHLTLDRPLDPKLAEQQSRELTRLGIGLDVPPEVITGYADVNHWNVWQVDEDTFKHHQEPVTIQGTDSLTLGYLRLRLSTPPPGREQPLWTADLIDRVVIGYDPRGLVAPRDMREPANDAYDRGTISDKAHRRLLGLDEADAPEVAITPDQPVGETGMTADQLNTVANIAGTLLRAGYEPEAVTTALGLQIAHTGLVPVTVKPEELPAAPPSAPQSPEETPPAEEAPPPAEEAPAASTAAGTPRPGVPSEEQRRLSRRLMEIDRRLRDRITAAADAALLRALERAGNRLRSRANGNTAARTAAAGQPGERVAAAMGRALVAALGADEQALLAEAFDRLHGQFTEWTAAASEEAIDTAARIAHLQRHDPNVMRAVGDLRDRFAEASETAWPLMHQGLTDLASDMLYEPDPAAPDLGELPDAAVPPGLVRQALAVAGGLAADATLSPPLSGLSSGALLQAFLRDHNSQPVEYEWAYGISSRTFHPHSRLDGVVFADFADPALSTAGTGAEWIGASFAPGDHKGCHCDYAVIYADGNTRDELEAIGRAAYREQKPGEAVPGWDATTKIGERRPQVRPEPRRSQAAEASAAARLRPAPQPLPPSVPPDPPPTPTGRTRSLDGEYDDDGHPWTLDHDYLSALDPEQFDELLTHAAATMDDLDPRSVERWTDLEQWLDFQDRRALFGEELSEEGLDTGAYFARLREWEDANGRPGLTHPRVGGHDMGPTVTRAEVQEEYALWVEEQYLAASETTRGHLLNATGRAQGVSVHSLFSGDVRRVYRFASEELLDYWEANPRITYTQYYHQRTGSPAFAEAAKRHAIENAGINRDRTNRPVDTRRKEGRRSG